MPNLFRNSRGMTLVELLVGLSLTMLLCAMIWKTLDATLSVGFQRWQAETRQSAVQDAERAIRRAMGNPSTLQAPNAGPVMIRPGTSSTSDTLVLLRTEGPPLNLASRPCPNPGCILLLGDHTSEIAPGDLLAVGSTRTGLSFLQVSESPRTYAAPCGSDCGEHLSCVYLPAPLSTTTHVIGAQWTPAGRGDPNAPCPAAVLPDGSRCQERRAPVVMPQRQDPQCGSTGSQILYTEIHLTDRTSLLGFPTAPQPLLESHGPYPRIRAQKVRSTRFWVNETGHVLYRQRDLRIDEEGWNPAEVLAAPILNLQAETLQATDSHWTHGTGIPSSDLIMDTSNPNFRDQSPTDAGLPGYHFLRGYHTLTALRVRLSVPETSDPQDSTAPRILNRWILVSLRPLQDASTLPAS